MITAAAPAFLRLRPPVTSVLGRRDPPPARPSWPAAMKPRSRSTTAVTEPLKTLSQLRIRELNDPEVDTATLTEMSWSASRSSSGPARHSSKRRYGAEQVAHLSSLPLLMPSPDRSSVDESVLTCGNARTL